MMMQRWTDGAIVSIPIGSGQHVLGQMLKFPEYAVFGDVRSDAETAPTDADLARSRLIFRVWVDRSSFSRGRWLKVGKAPIGEALAAPVARFNQDPLQPSVVVLHIGQDRVPTTVSECLSLNVERAAVWSAEHVEDRVRDYLAGRPNRWVELLRVRQV
jgi:hypothetical protein